MRYRVLLITTLLLLLFYDWKSERSISIAPSSFTASSSVFFYVFFHFFLVIFWVFFLREMRRFLSGNRLEVCEGFHGTSSIVCWIFFLRFFFKFRSAAFFFVLFFFLCGISHEPARPPVLAILARPKRPNQLKF